MSNPAENVRFSSPATIAPAFGYSHVAEVVSGRLIYLAGQVPLDLEGKLVGQDDLQAQIRQTFENIKAVLESVGANFNNVVKLTYYMLDISQIVKVREIRDQYVNTAQPPVSTALEVRRLFQEGILIEIEAIAVVPA